MKQDTNTAQGIGESEERCQAGSVSGVVRVRHHSAIWNNWLRFSKQVLQEETELYVYVYIREQVTIFKKVTMKKQSQNNS